MWIVGESAWFGLCEGWTGQGCHCQVFLWVEFLGAAAVCECVFICLGGGCEIAGIKSSTSVSDTTDPRPEKSDRQSDRWIWVASISQSDIQQCQGLTQWWICHVTIKQQLFSLLKPNR